MILYLDSSALVKLVTEEAGSEDVVRAAEDASGVASAAIAYAEARAAIARAAQERRLTRAAATVAKRNLDRGWPDIQAAVVDEPLAKAAGDLAERHRLRGMDAIHLAAAAAVAASVREPVLFASFDERQRRGAAAERFALLPASVAS